ncbi:hypothetical protein [Mesorhizobium sp. M0047]|uniref:hypothetical protein n=1 Tax=Mesorhizobium sp. M0047 TaxID=2956859 RepID=UPI003338FD12
MTLTAIQRHVAPDKEGIERLRIEPKFSSFDMEDAASLAALALLNATRILLVLVPEIAQANGFAALQRRYASLYRQGLRSLRKAEQKANTGTA